MFVVYSLFHPEGRVTRFENVYVDGVTDTEEGLYSGVATFCLIGLQTFLKWQH